MWEKLSNSKNSYMNSFIQNFISNFIFPKITIFMEKIYKNFYNCIDTFSFLFYNYALLNVYVRNKRC